MVLSLFILIGWFVCIFICYYVIRPISSKLIRFVLTCFSCILLTYVTCQNLPRFDSISILIVAICWLMSIRLIALTSFSRTTLLTFKLFLLKILWIYFPILPKNKAKNQWPILFHIILIIIKLLINHWIYRWFIKCELGISYERIFMLYLSIITISYVLDIEMILVRILTQDKYTLESFTNFPILSLSLREFWGQRYNQIVNTILKESVFEPMQLELSSSTIAALITFIISGLIHVHICFVGFNDTSSLFPTFMFFFLHGIACSLETNMKIKLPEHAGWLITHAFLLITSPLMLRPLIKKGCPFLMLNPPPLINIEWIPKLSVPNFCPQ
ncbi:unnamed protein product [Rotaria sp. Silwood2]|nr:unnamed protein product [Rotaria sp. Silwood2]CAF4142446.1 unnamed protein product [Rotaria sp. Silwood2]